MDNILRMHGPSDSARGDSAFQRYQQIGDMKKSWKKFKSQKTQAGEDQTDTDYLEVLPREVRDLPAEYYLQAFAYDAAEQSRP